MKGLIKKDLLLVKNNIKSLIVLFFVFILMTIQGSFDVSFGLPLMCVMLFISTFSYDDFNNWNAYAITLPYGKENIVKSKYVATLIISVISIIIGIGISLLVSLINGIIDFENILTSCITGIISITIIVSIMYPLIFKYGTEKGRIYLFFVIFIIITLGGLITSKTNINLTEIIAFLNSNLQLLGIIIFSILICIMFSSYKISKYIYLKKEF